MDRFVDASGAAARGPAVRMEAGSSFELIAGLCARTLPGASFLPRSFDKHRTKPHGLQADLDALIGSGRAFAFLLGLADRLGAAADVQTLLERLGRLDSGDLWLTLVGAHGRRPPGIPGELYTAGPHDPSARRRLAGALASAADTVALAPVAATDPGMARERLLDLLERLHDEVLRDHIAAVMPELDAAAGSMRRFAGRLPDVGLVEAMTRGMVRVGDDGRGEVLLVPQAVMGDWTLVTRHDELLIVLVPASAPRDRGDDPPPELVSICDALGDAQRLRILRRISGDAQTVQQVADHLRVAKSTAHHHLATLRAAGVISRDARRVDADVLRRGAALLDAYLASAEHPSGCWSGCG